MILGSAGSTASVVRNRFTGGCGNGLTPQSSLILKDLDTATLTDTVVVTTACESAMRADDIVTDVTLSGGSYTGGTVAAVELTGTTDGVDFSDSIFSGALIGLDIEAGVQTGTLAVDLTLSGSSDDCVDAGSLLNDFTGKCGGAPPPMAVTLSLTPTSGTEPLMVDLSGVVSDFVPPITIDAYCDCPAFPTLPGTASDSSVQSVGDFNFLGICVYEDGAYTPCVGVTDSTP